MKLGFTGTQQGMTGAQLTAFHLLIAKLFADDEEDNELHHGDCVGSDGQVDAITKRLTWAKVHAHPSTDPKKRAHCQSPTVVHPPKPYLVRNKDIVAAGVDGLIATPKDFVKPKSLRGQGTWTTIGYAQKAGRKLWIILPDGSIESEPRT